MELSPFPWVKRSFRTLLNPSPSFGEKNDFKKKFFSVFVLPTSHSPLGNSPSFKKDIIVGKSGCVWEPSTFIYNLCVKYEGKR